MLSTTRLLALSTLLTPILAHIALWDPAMYGWTDDPNQWDPVVPLMHLPFDQWWFHGYMNVPPAEGKFMTLPSGGTYNGQVACNKALTKYGQNPAQQTGIYACDGPTDQGGIGAMHTSDKWNSPDPVDLKGCAIAIAYESDPTKIKPEDFTVISVNHKCVWFKDIDFQIPSDLPPCPPGGCHCLWEWIHADDAGSEQLFHLAYRCTVEGATGTRPLPQARTANKCPVDKSNCTVGAKLPHYWYQAEGNNNPQGQYDPPFFNDDYGFADGAQMDLFATVANSSDTSTTSDTPDQSSTSQSPQSSESPETQNHPSSTSIFTTSTSTPASSVNNQQAAATANTAVSSISTSSSTSTPSSTSGSGSTCARRKRAMSNLADPVLLERHRKRKVRRSQRKAEKRSAAVRKSILDNGEDSSRFGLAQREWEEEVMIKRLVGL